MNDENKKIDTRSGMKKVADGLDFFFNKLLPKKLLVIVVATIIVFKQLDVPEEYWYLLLGYTGMNIVGKFTSAFGNRSSNSSSTDSDIAG